MKDFLSNGYASITRFFNTPSEEEAIDPPLPEYPTHDNDPEPDLGRRLERLARMVG